MKPEARLLVSVFALVVAGPTTGRGQFVSLRQVGGELGLGFDGSWTNSTAFRRTRIAGFEERLRLDMAGYLQSPNLVGFTLFLSPAWQQRTFAGFDTTDTNGNGNRLAFGFRANLLQRAPIRITLGASRFDGRERDRFGNVTEGEIGHLAASLSYPNVFFPTTVLSYDRLSTDVVRRSGISSFRIQDQTLKTLRLAGENRKTRILLERYSRSFRTTSGGEATTTQATITNRQRWGKGSNLNSTYRYLQRTGIRRIGSSTLSWAQNVRLQHLVQLSSNYAYRLYSQSNGASSANGWRWDIGTQYRPARRLNLGLNGGASADRFDSAKRSRYRIRTTAGYSFSLPLGALFRGGASLGYDWLDQEIGDQTLITVLNERHIVDESRRFTLDNLQVDAASVTVNSADGTERFEPDFDYRLIESGLRLDVLVVPGSRIAVGDTLLIDYVYEAAPSGNGGYGTVTLRGLIRWGGISVSHIQVERREGSGSNLSDAFVLANSTEARTNLAVRVTAPWGPAQIVGERSRTLTKAIDVESYRLRANTSIFVTKSLTGSLGLNVTDNRNGDQPLNVYSGSAGLSWRPLRRLRLSSHVTAWTIRQRLRDSQDWISGGASLDWQIYRVSLRAQYDHLSISEVTFLKENRLMLGVARQF